jgi:hypothetical protein
MVRKVMAAAVVLVLSVGFTFAEEIRAVITKVDGNKITFAKMEGKGPDAKKGEEMTLPVAKGVKVVNVKFNREEKKLEVGDAVEGGLKNKMFTRIGDKGVRGMIITDADGKKITEIRVMQRFGKKKKDQ